MKGVVAIIVLDEKHRVEIVRDSANQTYRYHGLAPKGTRVQLVNGIWKPAK